MFVLFNDALKWVTGQFSTQTLPLQSHVAVKHAECNLAFPENYVVRMPEYVASKFVYIVQQ